MPGGKEARSRLPLKEAMVSVSSPSTSFIFAASGAK